jgi:hypothetical protein
MAAQSQIMFLLADRVARYIHAEMGYHYPVYDNADLRAVRPNDHVLLGSWTTHGDFAWYPEYLVRTRSDGCYVETWFTEYRRNRHGRYMMYDFCCLDVARITAMDEVHLHVELMELTVAWEILSRQR